MQSNAVQVSVMDIQGRICYSESRYVKDQTFISLGMNVKPGIYIVSLQNEQFKEVKKIIVQ